LDAWNVQGHLHIHMHNAPLCIMAGESCEAAMLLKGVCTSNMHREGLNPALPKKSGFTLDPWQVGRTCRFRHHSSPPYVMTDRLAQLPCITVPSFLAKSRSQDHNTASRLSLSSSIHCDQGGAHLYHDENGRFALSWLTADDQCRRWPCRAQHYEGNLHTTAMHAHFG
jgi:hypothetical protein